MLQKINRWIINNPAVYFGGSNRARTDDPLLVRQVLSLLSYAPHALNVDSLAH